MQLSLDEFYAQVSAREGVIDLPIARQHARTVMAVLKEAVSPGEINHVRSVLPKEYSPLFEAPAESGPSAGAG